MRLLPMILVAATIGLAGPVAAQGEPPARTITVTGEGQAVAAPDMATITIGVTERNAGAELAADAVNARIGEVIELLGTLGILVAVEPVAQVGAVQVAEVGSVP